ncbi:MAG: hypothetical protein HOG95_18630 [Rhodospirillaceae bacterium]|jgi:hypothetical protein|nr:hypothetical protein [Rhodospirillaceae bacterium]MBT4588990.1 hypothetical protein [Rhodospirillaceae bacterium]MBT5941950.1 hypothetical protein [Rhodospirillaceae bacterium]MBT7268355.1 hypothetical protein [Rhodospirillaceae bacterium]
MKRILNILGQGLAYLAFALVIGYFSSQPTYHPFEAGQALVKLSISHAGQRKQACTERAVDHQRNIPTTARKLMDCPRERHPVTIKLMIDGKAVFDATSKPSGLSNDGRSLFYHRFPVKSGTHEIKVQLFEAEISQGAHYKFAQNIELKAGDIAVVGFNPTAKAIFFK